MEKLDFAAKEKYGWLILAERYLEKTWDSEKDEEVWTNYL